ncbi:MAG: hypothetical protein J7K13_06675 [Thermoplasmata archaeon]|nr:hypothetical protein [Thermoplasmata archaeon]
MAFKFNKSEKEKIKIELEKDTFSPGENIRGRIILKLDKPLQAKGLILTFVGQKYRKGLASYFLGRWRIYHIKSLGWGFYNFFKEELQIDTEKEYYGMIYPFEYKIPQNILLEAENWKDKIPTAKIIDEIVSEEVYKETEWSNRWYLEARLKISHGKDIKNKIEIKIT